MRVGELALFTTILLETRLNAGVTDLHSRLLSLLPFFLNLSEKSGKKKNLSVHFRNT